jgi:ribonuclease VapC
LSNAVLDASAILAFLNQETGHQRVAELLRDGAVVSAVNLAEVAARLSEAGGSDSQIRIILDVLQLEVAAFGADLAYRTAMLRLPTRHLGLSLGDRACLALAEQLGLPAVSADRAWGNLQIGVPIELLR